MSILDGLVYAEGLKNVSKRVYLLEAILGMGFIIAVNLLFFKENIGFVDVSPHPYLLVILPIATRYGFAGGLFSGILAGVCYFIFKAATFPDVSILDVMAFDVWGKPLMFIVIGAVLGEIRQVQMDRYNEMVVRHQELQANYDRQMEHLEALSKAKEEVDTRIVSQEHTLATLYEATLNLRSLEIQDIYPAILELLNDYTGAQECAIYIRSKKGLTLKGAITLNGTKPPETMRLSDSGLAMKALKTKRTQSLNTEIREDQMPERDVLIAAPITTSDDSKVMGVIEILSMPFVKFTPTNVQMADLIADWCGAALENALIYNKTKDKLIADDATNAYRFDYLKKRLEEEFFRARRYKLELSLLVMDFLGPEKLEPAMAQAALQEISLVLKSKIRNIDLLFLNKKPNSFVLVLPTTPPIGAKVVAKNMGEAFAELYTGMTDSPVTAMRIGVGAFEEGVDSHSDIYSEAMRNRERVEFTV